MRLALPLAAAAIVVLPVTGAQATPVNWAACSAAAGDLRALRACSTAREDIAACERRQGGQDLGAPTRCLQAILAQWAAVAAAEDRALGPADGRADTADWLAGRDALCRDPEQIRLGAERIGPDAAAFDVAKCELNQTIRRAIDSVARRRGLR